MFKERNPKRIYLVVSYGSAPLISAAYDNGIETIEIQHGVIDRYHLGYSFPNNDTIPYFPDKMMMFGKFWYDTTPIPISKNNIELYGFPYLEKQILQYKIIDKKKNQILFISQGTIGKELSDIAYKFARKNKDYNIVYKLHPGEYDRWEAEYESLVNANSLDNFTIIDEKSVKLYDLFVESTYLVGVYSTAIYEGLAFNCNVILINLPGIEYMEYLIKNDFVKLAINENDILVYLQENNFKKRINKKMFFCNLN